MPTLKLTIEYVGTAYHGWQAQPGLPTIQGALLDALAAILRKPVTLRGAARTDAGVHARGQVASLQVAEGVDPGRLRKQIDGILPGDIGVRALEVAPDTFHARHSAKGRIYRYRIVEGEYISPFFRAFAMHCGHRLDLDRMARAAGLLVGEHDFTSFRASGDPSESSIKVIRQSEVSVESGNQKVITYTVEADSFLQHMVRNLAGTLVEVGRGRIHPEKIPEILHARDRRLAGPTAPARGLCLEEVLYPTLRGTIADDSISTLDRIV